MSASSSLRKRAWVFAIACAAVALPAVANAAPVFKQSDTAIAGPFGLATKALAEGPLTVKWRTVERAIEGELKTIALCRADRANCASPRALQFLKIVDDASVQTGLARVGEINRAFNLAIRPMSDQAQYGVEDVWTSPLATLAAGAGDCEDYAIAKLVALREAGFSSDDLRLVILRGVSNGEDHAVVAARVDGRWRMLDNRYFLMIEDCDVTKLQPVFAIDANGATRFEQPSIAVAALPTEKPAMPVTSAVTEYDDSGLSTSAIDLQLTSAADSEFWQTRAM
jgi:predicted transglutaminase-like cysteine proteinase